MDAHRRAAEPHAYDASSTAGAADTFGSRATRVVRGIPRRAGRQVGEGAAAEDTIVLLPESASGHREDLGGRVVVELADRAALGGGQVGEDLDPRQHGERQGAEDEVALGAAEPACFAVHGGSAPAQRILLETNDLAAHARPGAQLRGHRRGWAIGAADDLVEALRPDPVVLLAQVLGGGTVEERLAPGRDGEKFDRLDREALRLEQLAEGLSIEHLDRGRARLDREEIVALRFRERTEASED